MRNEHIRPISWNAPGTLQLEESLMLRGDNDVKYEFTVKFTGEEGKFRVVSKKQIADPQTD